MTFENIITCIIVPIVSAIIGGGLTLIGVLITIKSENKKRSGELKLANKPIFYLINPMQDYDYKNAVFFRFDDDKNGAKRNIEFIFRNTDNAVLVFNYISIDDHKFFPTNGNVVDKATTFYIEVYATRDTKIEKNSSIVLSVKDLSGNVYNYELAYSSKDSKIIDVCKEVTTR